MTDFGEILRSIGDFGLFQQLLLVTVSFPNIVLAFLLASLVFIESDPERHCNTDWILRTGVNLTKEEQLNLTLPRDQDGTFSRCQMFVPVDWDINAIREYGLNETTGCQDGWVYANKVFEATIVTDYDLVCSHANLVKVAQTVSMTGILVGSLLFGPCAESYGRKRATQIPLVILILFTLTTAFSPNIYFYIASQFLMQCGMGGYRVNAIILSTEWIGVSKRSWGVCVVMLFSSIGQCVLAGLMYSIRNWRITQLITVAPLGIALVYIWFIPESARWLLSRGRTEEAKGLIMKAASINRQPVPDTLLDKIVVNNNENQGGLKVILRSPILSKYFFIVTLAWFALNMCGFSLYMDMENLGLSIFMTQLLFGIFEIPACLLSMWLLEVFGRKILFLFTVMTGGLSTMFILAVPQGYSIAVTCLAVAARFFLLWAGSVTCIYMQELVPTSVRQTATALGSIAGRAGGLLAPLVNMLAVYHSAIPIALVSSLTLVGGALGFLLPETRRKELPETTKEAENNRNAIFDKAKKLREIHSTNM